MEKRWQKTEIAYLKRNAGAQSLDQLADRLNTDTKTVRLKLEELGLHTDHGSDGSDPALADFEQALELLYRGKHQQAAKLLEGVIENGDSMRLRDRARQHLAICKRHLDPARDVEDPYLRAVMAKNRGDLDEALSHCKNPGKDERFAYLAASIHALQGAEDKALELLRTAIELEPKNRVHAFHDPDFAPMRGEEAFAELLANP